MGLRWVGLIGLALSGVASAAPPAVPATPQAPVSAGKVGGATFLSPMGEPFRSDPGGPAPDLLWFRQADANGDGKISLTEMRVDAQRFFKTLDRNGDGEIDPDEIQHYETDVAPEIGVFDIQGAEGIVIDNSSSNKDDAFSDLPGIQIVHRKPGERVKRGAAQFAYFDLPEPVAAADRDFNRGVSVQEFDQAAQARFHILDAAHDGYLTYAKLQALRH